jgi:hypothetical protein
VISDSDKRVFQDGIDVASGSASESFRVFFLTAAAMHGGRPKPNQSLERTNSAV